MPSSTINVRVDTEKKDRLDALAEATGRSRSLLIAEAIDRYLTEESWQIAKIQEGIADADAGRVYEDDEVQAEMLQVIAQTRARRASQ